ncbi:titin-like isoform X2 [Gigantopelta aegis]|uniref:titin-like isoform X2 n=1 Tax=Gigantopelta aegis TaxID=1735272 RepID=UPI001B88898E|nr:titin-like isoform X2 [Gigantopelta aegis]
MEDEDVLDRIMRHRFLLGTFDGDSIRARDASSPETSEAAPEIVTATDEQPPETSELGATASEPTPEKEIETPPPEDIEPPPPEEIEPPPPEEIEPSPQEDVVPAEDIVPEETDQSIKAEMKDDTRGGKAQYRPDSHNTADNEDDLDRIMRQRFLSLSEDSDDFPRRREPPPEEIEPPPPEDIEPPPPEEIEPPPPEEIEPPPPEEIVAPSPEEIEPSPQDVAPADDIAPDQTDESIKAEMEDETGTYQSPVLTDLVKKLNKPAGGLEGLLGTPDEEPMVFRRAMYYPDDYNTTDDEDILDRINRHRHILGTKDGNGYLRRSEPPPEMSEVAPVIATATDEQPPEEIEPPPPEESEPLPPEEIEPPLPEEIEPPSPEEIEPSPQEDTAPAEDIAPEMTDESIKAEMEDETVPTEPDEKRGSPQYRPDDHNTADNEDDLDRIMRQRFLSLSEDSDDFPRRSERQPEMSEVAPVTATDEQPPEEIEPPPPEESEPLPPEEIKPPLPEEIEPPSPEEIEPSPQEDTAPAEDIAPEMTDESIKAEMEDETVPTEPDEKRGSPQYRPDDHNTADNEDDLDRIMRQRFLSLSEDSDDFPRRSERQPEMSEVAPVTATDEQPPEEIEPPPPEEIEPPPPEEIEPPPPEESEPPPPEEIEPPPEETEPPPPEETEPPPPEETEPPPPEESEPPPPEEIEPPPPEETEPPPPEESEAPPPEEIEPSPEEAVAPVEGVAPKESDGRIQAEMEKDTPCGLDTCRSRFLTKLVPMLSEPPEGDLGTEEENPQYLRLDDYNVTDNEDILDRIMRNRFLLRSKDSDDAQKKDEPPPEMSEVVPVIATASDQQPPEEIEPPPPEEIEPPPIEEIEPPSPEETEPPSLEETEPPPPEETESPPPEEIEPPPPEESELQALESEPPPPEEIEPPPPEESEPSPQEAVAPVEDVAPKESDGRIRAEMEKDTPCGLDTCRSRFLTKLVPMLSEPPEGDLGTEEENPQYLRLDDYNVTDDEDILDRIMRNRFLLGSKDSEDAGEKDEPPSEMSEVAPVIPTTSDQQPADEIETPAPEERELQQFESTPTPPEEIEPTPLEEIEPPPQEETEPPLPEEIEPPNPEEIEPPPPEETEPPPPEETEPPPPEESEPSPQEAVAPVEDVAPKESDGRIRAEMEKDTPCGLDTCRSRFLTKLVPMLSEPPEGDLGTEEENPQYLRLDDYNVTDDEDILDRIMRNRFLLGSKDRDDAGEKDEPPSEMSEVAPVIPTTSDQQPADEIETPAPEERELQQFESTPTFPEEIEPTPPEEIEPPPQEETEPPLPEEIEPPPPEEIEPPPPEETEPPPPEEIEPPPPEESETQTPESEPPPPEEIEPPPPEESEPSPQEAVAPVEDVVPKESDGCIRAEMEKDTPCGLDTCRSRFLTKLVPMLSEPLEGDLGMEEENPQYLRIDDYNIMDDEDILNKVMRPRFLSGSKDNDGAPPPEETEPPPPEEIEPPPPEEYESPPPQEDVAPADDIVPEKTEIMAEMEDNTCGDPDTYQSPMLTELVEKLGEPPEGLEGALCESEDNPLVLQRFMVRQGSNDFEDYTTPSRLAHVGEGACITETDSDGLVDYTADVIADVMEPELTATLPMMETDSDIPAKDTEDSEPDFMTPVHKEELRKVFADKLEEELMMKLEDEPKEELMIEESKEEPEIVETEEEPSTKLEEELTEESKEELMIEESKEEPEIVETEEEPSTRLEEELMEKQEEEPKEELMIEESKEEPEIVETEEEPSTRLEEELMEKQDEEPKEELKMEESKEEPEIVETEEESAAERKFSVADSDLSDGYAVPSRLAHTGFGPDMQEPELAAALPTQEKEPDIVETEEVPSTKPEEELMENQEEELSIEESKEEPEIVETEEEPSTKLEELTEKQEEEPKEELKIEESKEEPEIVETEEESAAERKFSVADSDLSDGYAVPSRLAHTGFDPDMQEPELAAALPIQEKEPEIVETEDVPSTKPEEELMENQEEEPKEELMIEESKEEPEIVDTEEEPSTKLEEELMEKQEEEPKEELKIKESKIVEMKQEICTPAKKLPVETKGRKNSAGDYENPELILRKLQKVHVNKAKMETPTKASEIMDELKRLNSLLVDDQRRLFEESLWGKEAIHEIMKLEELKSILERQVDAGGDGSIPNKQLNMFQLELDDREQLLMKIMTLYHQCESELQATQQELFYLQEYIAMLETQYTQSEDLNREAVDELKKKAEIIVCLRTELQQVKCILDQAQLQNEQLRTKIKQLMEDIKKLTIDKKDLEAKIDRERLTSEEVERVYRQTMEELVQKCNLLVALEMEVQQAKNLLGNVEETRTMLQKNIEELTVHVTQATSMHESVEVTIARERASMAKRRLSASVIKEQHDMKLQQLEAMNRDRALLLKNIADERDKSEKLREALDKKENSVEDQVSQLTTSQQEIDRQLEEMAMLKERAEQLEKEKALVLTDYNNLCKQLDEKGQELSDMQDSYDLKIESMKNVVMLQQTGREQITKSYKIAITSARDEIKSLNVVMRHKEVQLQSYSGALQELQEIFMYSFFKSSNIQS